jgi:hypothetical protein
LRLEQPCRNQYVSELPLGQTRIAFAAEKAPATGLLANKLRE